MVVNWNSCSRSPLRDFRPRSGRIFLHIFLQFRIRGRFFKTYYHGFQIDWPRSGQHFSIYRHLIEKTIDFRLNFNLPCTYYPTWFQFTTQEISIYRPTIISIYRLTDFNLPSGSIYRLKFQFTIRDFNLPPTTRPNFCSRFKFTIW